MIRHIENTSDKQQPLHLLIVDDNPQVRHDLHLLLGLSEVLEIVGEAANGLEAIQQTMELNPDVVLMDMEMPVLDGYEAARQIKLRWPACRVVALTIHSYSSAREKADQAGVDEFIEKGAPLHEILSKISISAG